MSPLATQRYKELKDWLKILSPISAAIILSFRFGIMYADARENVIKKVQKWDGYENVIMQHEAADSSIHNSIFQKFEQIADAKKHKLNNQN